MTDIERQKLLTDTANEIFKLRQPEEGENDFLQQLITELGELSEGESLYLHSLYLTLTNQRELA